MIYCKRMTNNFKKIFRNVLFLALLISTCGFAGAGRFDYQQIELENGLDVITLEDFSCPIVTVQVWYHVGSKNEQPNRRGFAHMFEHMMFRGTDRLGPTDHFDFIRKVGGTSNGYTGFDRTVYLQSLPANQIELALWLEAERMTFLNINQENFDTERKVVEEERRMKLNEPYGESLDSLMSEIFKVHPYRWLPIGNIADLRASRVSELRDFWKKYYVPGNAALLIVGAVEHRKAQDLARKYFGWIPRYDKPETVTIKEPLPEKPGSVTLDEDNAPAPVAGVVYRSVPLKDTDTIAIDLLAEILGGGNSSRLYRQLVAQNQLAVYAEAISWSFEQDGIFAAGAVLPPLGADPNKALDVIKAEIARLCEEPVRPEELTKAKNQMLRELVTQNLQIGSKARALGDAAVLIGDISYVNRQLDNIRSVTPEDILRVARTYLAEKKALEARIDRNLSGTISERKSAEEISPITAEPEHKAPKPGRDGTVRPARYPKKAPFGKLAAPKLKFEYTSDMLDNGLKVIVVSNSEVPFVTAQLGLLAGSWSEAKPGSASMALKMLTKGTVNYSEAQLAEELETYAISIAGRCEMDTGTVTMSCLTDHLERGMMLLGEVVLQPTFSADEFSKLRNQILTSLAVSSTEPDYIAEREFRRRLYGKHPYSRTAVGEIEDVNALRVEDLKSWWEEAVEPGEAVLIFAGDIEHDRAMGLARKTFGSWPAKANHIIPRLPELSEPNNTTIYLVDKPDSTQSQIRTGQIGITRHEQPDYFVSRIVSNYFGWSFNSRLNRTIRVERGLTYGVWGGYTAKRFAGAFEAGTFSKTETTVQAVKAVLEEIERLRTVQPSEEELKDSKSYILGSFVMNRETPQQIADDLWLIESQNLGADYLDRLLKSISKTKRKDCLLLTQKTIDPGKMVIVVVGKAADLKQQLEEIAPVVVINLK
ncbi:MAG: pitrilysin family protein [Planctomycetota bacterium]